VAPANQDKEHLMPERFAQTGPTIDLSGIWQALVDHLDVIGSAVWAGIQDHLGEIGSAIWKDLAQWIYASLRALLLTLWNATLLPIPHSATDEFGPVQAMMPATANIAAAGIALAMALLGLRVVLRGTIGHSGAVDFLFGRFMVWACVLSMLPWILAHAIDTEQALARSVAGADLVGILPEQAVPNPLALLLMLVLGLRLWLKLASNVVHVAVAIVWSPVAAVCGLIPETQHIAGLWTHEFFGRLAGAVLATIASGVGLAYALTNTGDFAIFGVAGAFVAAHDLVDWLAKTPGSSVGGVVGGMIRTGAALNSLIGPAVMGSAGMPGIMGSGAAAGTSAAALPASRAMSTYYSFD
jgi:hypothetical protein